FNSAIPFLLLPFLTRVLTKEQYGTIDLFNNTSFILFPVVGLNIASCVIRFYYDKDIDVKKLISTAINFTIVSAFCLLIVSLVIINFIVIPNLYITVFLASLAYATFSQIAEVLLSYYRAIEKPTYYGYFRISKTLLDLSISVLILLYIYVGWEARVYTAVGISGLFALVTIFLLKSSNLFSF